MESGYFVVKEVLGHRVLDVHVSWIDSPVTTWELAVNFHKIVRVVEYCRANGLTLPVPAPLLLGRGHRRKPGT